MVYGKKGEVLYRASNHKHWTHRVSRAAKLTKLVGRVIMRLFSMFLQTCGEMHARV